MLQSARSDNGKLDFKLDLNTLVTMEPRRATIEISSDNWMKLRGIIAHETQECAWHGTVERNKDSFTITDVFMYPQEVAAATVQSTDEYDQWCINLDADIVNVMRFQGHSHVNFSASPSGVDTNNWDDWLQSIGDDDYYIFTIINKAGDSYWIIYDLASNTLFEKSDIDVYVVTADGTRITDWVKDQSDTFVKKKITPPTTTLHTPITASTLTATTGAGNANPTLTAKANAGIAVYDSAYWDKWEKDYYNQPSSGNTYQQRKQERSRVRI